MLTSTDTMPSLDRECLTADWVLPTFTRAVEPEADKTERSWILSGNQSDVVTLWEGSSRAFNRWAAKPCPHGRIWHSLFAAGRMAGSPQQQLTDIYFGMLLSMYRDQRTNTSDSLTAPWGRSACGENGRAGILPLAHYMDQLVAQDIVSLDVKETARRLWQKLRECSPGSLPEPDAAPSDGGRLVLAFDDGVRHLEFEIVGKDRIEVFSLRRDSNETWETELDGRLILDPPLLDRAKWFAQ